MPYSDVKLQQIVGEVTWQNAMKDTALTNSLRLFAKTEFSVENIRFLTDKGKPEDIYNKYISPKAAQQINLPSTIQGPADKLGSAGNFADKAWPGIIKAAKDVVSAMLQKDTIPRYLKSQGFKNYCAQNPAFKDHCLKMVQKPAKLLGVKNVKLLAQIAAELVLGDTAEAAKLTKKLEAEEKLKDLMKGLKAAGLV